MVSASTQTFIYNVIDAQQEFNMKLITLGILIFYVFAANIISKKMADDYIWKILFKLFTKIITYPIIFVLPWATIMLLREYSFISMWTNIIIFYGVIIVVLFVGAMALSFEFIFKVFGFDIDWGAMKRQRVRVFERKWL